MTELATGAEQSAPDTLPHAQIDDKSIDRMAEKVAETARETERERQAKADKALRAAQEKVFDEASKRREQKAAGEKADDTAKKDENRAPNGQFKSVAEQDKDVSKGLAPADKTQDKPKAEAEGRQDQQPKAADKTVQAEPEKATATAVKQPQSWSPEKKAVWDGLSPEAQQMIAQREQESHKAISRLGQFAKAYEPVAQMLETYREVFDSKKLSFQDGMRQLLDAQRMLDRDPGAALQHIAKSYGVDLWQLADQSNDQSSALRVENAQLQARLDQIERQQQMHAQRQAQQRNDSLEQDIATWSRDKADFAQLEQDIAAHAVQIRQAEPRLSTSEILDKAYERAQWGNPATRAKLIEGQQRVAEEKRLAEAKQRADQAQRANAINVNSEPLPTLPGDLRSAQEAAWDRIQARRQ